MNHTWRIMPNAKNKRLFVVKDKPIFLNYFYHNSEATFIIQTSEILFLNNFIKKHNSYLWNKWWFFIRNKTLQGKDESPLKTLNRLIKVKLIRSSIDALIFLSSIILFFFIEIKKSLQVDYKKLIKISFHFLRFND